MPINILMPALSPTMTEGNLAKWHKQPGDNVEPGDVIAEIETDKATMEVEAVDEGILGKILVEEGTQGVKVNELIAVLLEEGEDESAVKDVVANSNAPSAVPAPSPETVSSAPSAPSPHPSAAPQATGARVFATPLAKRLAKEKGLDLSHIKGSGPHGRIIKDDVLNAGAQSKAPQAVAAAPVALDGTPNTRTEAHSTMRKVIAKRLTESKQTVPHFYLTIDVTLDALLALRKQINDRGKGPKLSVNDFVIKRVAKPSSM
jgi:Pyruvate/2-oxoglutarate dehydrogenase complex, dihydrolipoamide acyltransferase (E2) component, and related enzymes